MPIDWIKDSIGRSYSTTVRLSENDFMCVCMCSLHIENTHAHINIGNLYERESFILLHFIFGLIWFRSYVYNEFHSVLELKFRYLANNNNERWAEIRWKIFLNFICRHETYILCYHQPMDNKKDRTKSLNWFSLIFVQMKFTRRVISYLWNECICHNLPCKKCYF